MIKGCKRKVSGITKKKDERKSVLRGRGKMRRIESSRSSRNRHLNICESAVGQKEPVGGRWAGFGDWGVRQPPLRVLTQH